MAGIYRYHSPLVTLPALLLCALIIHLETGCNTAA